MTGLLAAYQTIQLEQLVQHVLVSHGSASQFYPTRAKGNFKAHIAHNRGYHKLPLEYIFSQVVFGHYEEHMIAIHQFSALIDKESAIGIPIECYAEIKTALPNK